MRLELEMISTKGLVAAIAMAVTLGCAASDQPTQSDWSDGKADGVCNEGMSLSLARAFSSFTGNQPLAMEQDPQSLRWYVAERGGVIATMPADGSSRTVFADLRDRVNSIPDEAGLLGFALHPNFATNHEVFVSYTTGNLISRISRFNRSRTTTAAASRSDRTATFTSDSVMADPLAIR